jgi:hypothetical protein
MMKKMITKDGGLAEKFDATQLKGSCEAPTLQLRTETTLFTGDESAGHSKKN